MPTCVLCNKKDDDPEEYGEFMKKSGISVHYYCCLLATNLPQEGTDNAGILGFLIRDIRKESKNCVSRICRYCNKSHATIACHTCRKYYHNICGNTNGCVSEYINEFHSYCHEHVPFKDDPMLPGMPSECWICTEPLGEFHPTRTLRAYCCKNGYVHRSCMRRYALSAGYYLRCLWCGKKEFRENIRHHGVFVPDREARWDNNETVRFADLHRGYSRCDAKICLCPNGREFFRKTWKLCICRSCGASGIHDKCGGDKIVRKQYTCDFCADVLNKTSAAEELRKNNNHLAAFNYTLFISKSCEQFHPFEINKQPEKLQRKAPDVSASTVSSLPTKKTGAAGREMFIFGENNEIIGTGLMRAEAGQMTTKIKPSDVLEFYNTDPLMDMIIEELLAEGRDLSVDMADEVMKRMEMHLTLAGED